MRRPPDLPMRSQLVGPLLAYVRARGGDADRLIRDFGLPASVERDPEVTLPLSAMYAFSEAAERASGDSFLGLHVAATASRGPWDVLEYCSRSAPDARAALARVARYVALFNEHVAVSFRELPGGGGAIEQRVVGRPLALGRHFNEYWVATVVLQARQLLGRPFVPERVWLAHPSPPDASELRALCGTESVEFAAEANGVAMSAEVLASPIASHDPRLLALIDRYATQALASAPAGGDFLGAVRASIRRRLDGDGPDLAATARELGISARTLQRRLTEEGTSFHAQVDAIREELARMLVGERRLALGEIAYRLGYTELRAFLRAFKRWTGQTPGRHREQ